MPKTISSQFAPAVGAGPAWGVGIGSYKQVSLARVWSANEAVDTHNQYGWGHKLLWVVATTLSGSVTIRGTNLSTATPVYPDAQYAEDSSTPTTLILDPSDPTVVSQNANRGYALLAGLIAGVVVAIAGMLTPDGRNGTDAPYQSASVRVDSVQKSSS